MAGNNPRSFLFYIPAARVHFVTHAAVVNARWDKQASKFRAYFEHLPAHKLHNAAGFRACLLAKAFVCNHHQFFRVHVPNHINGRVLRCFGSVVIVLPVVSLAPYIRLGVNMPHEVNTYPIWAFDKERKMQPPYRAMPGAQNVKLPFFGRRCLGLLPDRNKGAGLYGFPIFCAGVFNQIYFNVVHAFPF